MRPVELLGRRENEFPSAVCQLNRGGGGPRAFSGCWNSGRPLGVAEDRFRIRQFPVKDLQRGTAFEILRGFADELLQRKRCGSEPEQ